MRDSSLEKLLRNHKTIDDIRDFCNDKQQLCKKSRDIICKKILEVSRYKVPNNTDTCEIFKELSKLSKTVEGGMNKNKMIMHDALFNAIDFYGSSSLIDFMIKNGYTMKPKKKATKTKKKIINTEILPKNYADTIKNNNIF